MDWGWSVDVVYSYGGPLIGRGWAQYLPYFPPCWPAFIKNKSLLMIKSRPECPSTNGNILSSLLQLVPATGIFYIPFCDWCPLRKGTHLLEMMHQTPGGGDDDVRVPAFPPPS
eukprot:1726691-Pyramimonas_sp.AAC.1